MKGGNAEKKKKRRSNQETEVLLWDRVLVPLKGIYITIELSFSERIESTRVLNAVLGCSLKNNRMISVLFEGNPLNITAIQVYAPTSNAEEAEVEWFYEDLQDLLELTLKTAVLFIIGDWNAKLRSQETLGVTGKFGLGVQNEAGQG